MPHPRYLQEADNRPSVVLNVRVGDWKTLLRVRRALGAYDCYLYVAFLSGTPLRHSSSACFDRGERLENPGWWGEPAQELPQWYVIYNDGMETPRAAVPVTLEGVFTELIRLRLVGVL